MRICKRNHKYEESIENTCRECSKINERKYYERNKELVKKRAKIYALNNKEKNKESKKKWRLNNKGRMNFLLAKSRAAKLQRTPKWLNKFQLTQISIIYLFARTLTEATGTKYAVDHIIPLRGKNMSGLHVPWNLQLMSKSENSRKSNKILERYLKK